MKKNLLIAASLIVLAFYLGSVLKADQPVLRLYKDAIKSINQAELINFKSLAVVRENGTDGNSDTAWRLKRQGVYDVKRGNLHYKNVLAYEYDQDDPRSKEEDTSLSFEEIGTLYMPQIKEAYYKNGRLQVLDRDLLEWADSELAQLFLIELLPFNADLINRQIELKASENRGKFVVYTLDINADFLSRNFDSILLADDLDFEARFVSGSLKILIYPDTGLTRRIYSDYIIENPATGQRYTYQLDTYFSANENNAYFQKES